MLHESTLLRATDNYSDLNHISKNERNILIAKAKRCLAWAHDPARTVVLGAEVRVRAKVKIWVRVRVTFRIRVKVRVDVRLRVRYRLPNTRTTTCVTTCCKGRFVGTHRESLD